MLVYIFSTTFSEIFLILGRNMIIIVYWSCRMVKRFKFLDRLSKNIQISNFMEILPVGRFLFHADRQSHRRIDGQTDRHDEFNSHFSKFFKHPKKLTKLRVIKERTKLNLELESSRICLLRDHIIYPLAKFCFAMYAVK
jgi:hypothetical protein